MYRKARTLKSFGKLTRTARIASSWSDVSSNKAADFFVRGMHYPFQANDSFKHFDSLLADFRQSTNRSITFDRNGNDCLAYLVTGQLPDMSKDVSMITKLKGEVEYYRLSALFEDWDKALLLDDAMESIGDFRAIRENSIDPQEALTCILHVISLR